MKLPRPSVLACLALAALTGCAGGPLSTRAPVSLPSEWKDAGGFPVASPGQDLSRWWGRFGDPTMSRLISTAIESSPDTRSASARVREARANRDAAYSALLPSLTGGGSTTSRRNRTDAGGSTSASSYSAGLDASWEIDLFGKNRSSVETAVANLGAAEENLHSVHAALAAEVAETYLNLRANEARLNVLKQNLVSREATAQLATWRWKSGEADSLEANQAQSSLETARAGLPALEQSLAQGRNTLALLAGGAPGTLNGMFSASRGIPQPPASLAIGIPADVLRQRPDVRLAGYQLLAAAATTRTVEASRYPSLNLSGSLGLDTSSSRKLFDPESAAANIIVGITSPIFDGGRIRANIRAASASEEQAIETYRKTVLTALSETENALIACRRSAERLVILEKATALAREADEIARQRYQAGEIDFLDVLDSQRTLLSLEDNLLTTRTDRTTAYVRLYQALGGGWSARG